MITSAAILFLIVLYDGHPRRSTCIIIVTQVLLASVFLGEVLGCSKMLRRPESNDASRTMNHTNKVRDVSSTIPWMTLALPKP